MPKSVPLSSYGAERKHVVNFTLDRESHALLHEIAENETDGNVSAAARLLIREAAEIRGLLFDESDA